jgi:hypothetical protein
MSKRKSLFASFFSSSDSPTAPASSSAPSPSLPDSSLPSGCSFEVFTPTAQLSNFFYLHHLPCRFDKSCRTASLSMPLPSPTTAHKYPPFKRYFPSSRDVAYQNVCAIGSSSGFVHVFGRQGEKHIPRECRWHFKVDRLQQGFSAAAASS